MTQVIGTCRGKKKQTKTNSIKQGRWGIWDKYTCTFISAVNNLPTRSNMIQKTFFNLLFYLNQ